MRFEKIVFYNILDHSGGGAGVGVGGFIYESCNDITKILEIITINLG